MLKIFLNLKEIGNSIEYGYGNYSNFVENYNKNENKKIILSVFTAFTLITPIALSSCSKINDVVDKVKSLKDDNNKNNKSGNSENNNADQNKTNEKENNNPNENTNTNPSENEEKDPNKNPDQNKDNTDKKDESDSKRPKPNIKEIVNIVKSAFRLFNVWELFSESLKEENRVVNYAQQDFSNFVSLENITDKGIGKQLNQFYEILSNFDSIIKDAKILILNLK